jgi:hypothetical protein
MIFLQLFIILLIIFLFFYIAYRLIQKQNTKYVFEGFQEGLDTSTITNITDKMLDMKLNQVCIKASYNTAFDGNKISTDQVKYVMSKGCRFLDFELYLKDGAVNVNYSTDPTYNMFNQSGVLFNDIKDTINDSLVKNSKDDKKTYVTPNPNDPLFIQLRFKSKDDKIFTIIGPILDGLNNRYKDSSNYAVQINGDTKLSELKSKVIIVMDKSIKPNYPESFDKYVNIITGGNTWSSQQYSLFKNQKTTPPKIKDDFKTTDVTQLKLLMPDVHENSPNPVNPFSLIENYGVQTIAFKFYKTDMALDLYETIFAEYQSAFVPLAYALQFIKNKKQQPDEKMTLKYGASFVSEK